LEVVSRQQAKQGELKRGRVYVWDGGEDQCPILPSQHLPKNST
jgi:hypothetical protein